jgi:hypothetical protein
MIKRYILILFGIVIVCFYKKFFVFLCVIIGAVFFPEASKILKHYCFGDGSELVLNADYIKNSPVVKRRLVTMKVGQKKRVGFEQSEDWRLSFALNGFTIEKQKNKVIISQWIKFDRSGEVKTVFFFIPISDNIVHTFNCTPYMARTEWYY